MSADSVLYVLGAFLAVPSLVLFAQALIGARRFSPRQQSDARLVTEVTQPTKQIGVTPAWGVVLVPAHNEAGVLPRTFAPLLDEVGAQARVLVVADNCSDETAAIARSLGAEVIERHDPLRRGKGFALDFGLRHLALNPPEIVVIVDADCTVSPGSIAALGERCRETGRPVQALYLMKAVQDGRGRLALFAWTIRNLIRPTAMHRMGLPCQLTGSGMAFPWSILSNVDLAHAKLAEDLELGAELACKGHAPLLLPSAIIYSELSESQAGADQQRERWIVGQLRAIRAWFLPLTARALTHAEIGPLALAFDMAVPPITMLGSGSLIATAICAASLGLGIASAGPLFLCLAGNIAFAAALTVCWRSMDSEANPDLSVRDALHFMSRGAALASRALSGRGERAWRRTQREPDRHPSDVS